MPVVVTQNRFITSLYVFSLHTKLHNIIQTVFYCNVHILFIMNQSADIKKNSCEVSNNSFVDVCVRCVCGRLASFTARRDAKRLCTCWSDKWRRPVGQLHNL